MLFTLKLQLFASLNKNVNECHNDPLFINNIIIGSNPTATDSVCVCAHAFMIQLILSAPFFFQHCHCYFSLVQAREVF